jgi:hypothetical protein
VPGAERVSLENVRQTNVSALRIDGSALLEQVPAKRGTSSDGGSENLSAALQTAIAVSPVTALADQEQSLANSGKAVAEAPLRRAPPPWNRPSGTRQRQLFRGNLRTSFDQL